MPSAEKFWNRTARHYDREEESSSATFQFVSSLSRNYLSPTDHILDFGCGTGSYACEFSRYVSHITGIDISSEMIRLARKKEINNAEFLRCSLSDCEVNGPYNVITVFYVLHLIRDPENTIKQLGDLLNSGGFLLTVTPCLGEQRLRWMGMAFLHKLGLIPEINPVTSAQLKALLEGNGLRLKESMLLPDTTNEYFMVLQKNEQIKSPQGQQ